MTTPTAVSLAPVAVAVVVVGIIGGFAYLINKAHSKSACALYKSHLINAKLKNEEVVLDSENFEWPSKVNVEPLFFFSYEAPSSS